jgi:hypothetical protein
VICLRLRSELIRAAVPIADRFGFSEASSVVFVQLAGKLKSASHDAMHIASVIFLQKPRGEVSGNIIRSELAPRSDPGSRKFRLGGCALTFWICTACAFRSHHAVIRVYDDAGNVIETHEHAGEFK